LEQLIENYTHPNIQANKRTLSRLPDHRLRRLAPDIQAGLRWIEAGHWRLLMILD
jgi:hypothetical protein